MATMTVNCGSFRKSSVGGTTVYGTLQNFQIPANSGITGCTVTFTTHAATGTTADRAFSINGVRAHSGWPSTGGSLTASLLSPGNNTFRVKLRSTGGATESCFWDISNITLTITYTDVGGGGGGSTGGGGPVVISPSNIDAGAGSVTVVCPAETGIWHWIDWTFGDHSGSWSHPWEAGGTNSINIPIEWASQLPNSTQGTLSITVRRSTTPTEPYSFATDQTINVTIKVPASVVPSIDSFGASRIANNTPAGVSGYVQNVSGVSLAISSVSGAYGSTISAYKITGAGYTFNASSGSIPVLSISGNIAFTAEVTDSRGRKATKVVGIDVLAYSAVSASNVFAYRSDASKNPADEGVFATLRSKVVISSLDGQNTGEVKGRVYEKGTAPTAWETMANDTLVLFGGSLSIEKTYTADIRVADLISSYQHSIDIPTATVIMGIAHDGDGVSFGTYPEAGKMKSAWPIIAPNFYPVGSIYQSTLSTSPATLFGGTWAALGGRMLIGVDETYTAGATGGAATHTLTKDELPNSQLTVNMDWSYGTVNGGSSFSYVPHSVNWSNNASLKTAAMGSGASHNNLPPYLAVYMWKRTA